MSADVVAFSQSHEDLTLSPSPSSTDVSPVPSPHQSFRLSGNGSVHLPDEIPSSPLSGLDDAADVILATVTYEQSRKRTEHNGTLVSGAESNKRRRTEATTAATSAPAIDRRTAAEHLSAANGHAATDAVTASHSTTTTDPSYLNQPVSHDRQLALQAVTAATDQLAQHGAASDHLTTTTDAASSLASIESTTAGPNHIHTNGSAQATYSLPADTHTVLDVSTPPASDALHSLEGTDASSVAIVATDTLSTAAPISSDHASAAVTDAGENATTSLPMYDPSTTVRTATESQDADQSATNGFTTVGVAHSSYSAPISAHDSTPTDHPAALPDSATADQTRISPASNTNGTAHHSDEQSTDDSNQPATTVSTSAFVGEQSSTRSLPSPSPDTASTSSASTSLTVDDSVTGIASTTVPALDASEEYQTPQKPAAIVHTSTTIDSEDEPEDEALLTTSEGDEDDMDDDDGYPISRRRKRKSQSSRKSRSILCPVCSSQHANEVDMYGHLASHHNQHTCPNCQAAYTDADSLKVHLIEHSRGRLHVCAFCGEGFTQSGHCKEHERIHTGEKPFICPVAGCQRGFSRNSYLKQHARIHTGEKRFVCDLCDKGFRQSSTLKSHKRIHTGEKPYSCPLCTKSFRHGNTRKAHMLSEHGQIVAKDPSLLGLDDDASVGSVTRSESNGDVATTVAPVVVPQPVVTPQKPAAPVKTPSKRKTPARTREPRSNAKSRRGDAMAQLTAAANGSTASSGGGSHPPHHNHSVLPDLLHPLPQHFPFPPFDMSKFEPPRPDMPATHSFPFSIASSQVKTEAGDGSIQPPRAHLPHFPFPFVPFPNTSGGTSFAAPSVGSNGALPFPPIPLLPPPHLLPADHPLLALVARHGMPPPDLPAHFFRLPPSRRAMRAAMNGASEAEVANEVRAEVDAEVEAATAAATATGVRAGSVSSLFTPAASFLSLQSAAVGLMPALSSSLSFASHAATMSPYPFNLPSPSIPSSSLLSAAHLSSPTLLPTSSSSASPPSLGLSLLSHFGSPSLLPSLMHSPTVPGLGLGGPLGVMTDSPPFSTRLPPLHRGVRGGSGEASGLNGTRRVKVEAAEVEAEAESSDDESDEEESELEEGERRSKSIFQPTLSTS